MCVCVCVCVWGEVVETGGYREAALQLFSQAVFFCSFLCEKWVRAALLHLLPAVDVEDQYSSHTVLKLPCAGRRNILLICLYLTYLRPRQADAEKPPHTAPSERAIASNQRTFKGALCNFLRAYKQK